MTSASENGTLAIWDLNKRTLAGQLPDAHRGPITSIRYLDGQPLMVSAGTDNTLKTWLNDMGDGMPRQLVLLEGHSQPVTAVKFIDSDIYKARSFVVRAKAKKKKRDIESIELKPVIQMDIGLTREAAWDNVLCRHMDTAPVTTWTTRKQALGTHRVRFFFRLLQIIL
ncbi:unnamed protein product [Gongylonema pulchrum]|uniref:WD_REPEATS_REGION domain-containing protein n=1 Tax=Gongylonema pulchrum TaxID=637853 RepID=A0A183D493_9BILA|nr:unnamed protein product [Gongylonema pulchrum]